MRDLHIGDIPPDCPGAGQSLLLWVQSHVQRSDRLSRRADQPSLRDDPEYQALLDNFGPSRATPGDSLKLILRETAVWPSAHSRAGDKTPHVIAMSRRDNLAGSTSGGKPV
ncbi:hypothetical protein RRG08_058242 [Elysia crispata]|uniref:Uncharacterized protein n=1 Tax=Elysia crispata TaxID=231223 RepID=A0AAE0YVA5_9GAST|nr:hypothetical protein RRG08_058242 [Elysia crispata]